jgi:hypothetical protein
MTCNTIWWIGFGVLALGGWLAFKEHRWLSRSQVAKGTVIELVSRYDSDGSTYRPRVQFKARDGSEHEFLRSYGSSPAGFTEGESVLVAYDASTYEGRILTFGQRFGFATVLIILGLATMTTSWCFVLGGRLLVRVYLPAG